jgi:Transglutaminase-like superfamily
VTAVRRAVRAVRAGWWTLRALRDVRSQLAQHALAPIVVPALPVSLAASGPRAVETVLRWRGASCLQRATVLQAWYVGQGRPRDVVLGVRGPASFGAHAWLDGSAGGSGYEELVRRTPSALVMRRRVPLRESLRSR